MPLAKMMPAATSAAQSSASSHPGPPASATAIPMKAARIKLPSVLGWFEAMAAEQQVNSISRFGNHLGVTLAKEGRGAKKKGDKQ